MHPAILGLITIIIGVGGCVGYFYGANLFLDKVLFPAKGPNAGANINRANMIRPWVFLMPAIIALGLYLAYPVVATLILSFQERLPGGARGWVGFENYSQMFAEPKFMEAMRNNVLWLVVVPAASTAFGLLAAQLTDRLKWGSIAKSIIFMPMAISFVGAAVIFKLVYESRPEDTAQIGVINAIWLQMEGGIGSWLLLRLVPAAILFVVALGTLYMAYVSLKALSEKGNMTWAKAIGSFIAVAVVGAVLSYIAILLVPGFAEYPILVAAVAVIFILIIGFIVAGMLLDPARITVGDRMSYTVIAVGLTIGIVSLLNIFGLFTAEFDYGEPQQWLTVPFWNNFFLMIVLIWIQTGFAMVILSAALRGIPEETVEAAVIDGANPFQIFFSIKIPQIMSTIVVVWTTITIATLKVFDIVFAMTNGQWETQVLANYMYDKLFRANDWGMGSAAAMIIMLLVTPILVWNVYNARKEMR